MSVDCQESYSGMPGGPQTKLQVLQLLCWTITRSKKSRNLWKGFSETPGQGRMPALSSTWFKPKELRAGSAFDFLEHDGCIFTWYRIIYNKAELLRAQK